MLTGMSRYLVLQLLHTRTVVNVCEPQCSTRKLDEDDFSQPGVLFVCVPVVRPADERRRVDNWYQGNIMVINFFLLLANTNGTAS